MSQKTRFKTAAKRCKGKPGFRACMAKNLRKGGKK